MKKQITSFFCFLLIIGLTSCASRKKVVDSKQIKNFNLTTKSKVKKNSFKYTDVSMKIKATYKAGTNNQSFTMNIKMRRDSFIWVSVSAFGVEGGRALITPDSFKLINRINRSYCLNSIDYLSHYTKQKFTLNQLQNLLLGNSIFELDAYKKKNNEARNNYYSNKEGDITHNFTINELFRPMWAMLIDKNANQSLDITYKTYKKVKRLGYLPTQMDINASANNQKIEIHLNYATINVEPIESISFRISKKFKERC